MERTYVKKCECGKLIRELQDAGFAVDTVLIVGDKVRIRFPDSETKNPAEIVAAHVYTEPEITQPLTRDELTKLRALIQ